MSAISTDVSAASAATRKTPDPYASLDSDQFMRIIFAELSSQDPLSPNDTKALLEQISLIRSIQSDLGLAEQLESVVKRNELTASATLVGQFVTGRDENFTESAGFVDSVLVTGDKILLKLSSGAYVPLDHVEEIIDPEIVRIGTPTDGETGGTDETDETDESTPGTGE